MKQYHNCDRCIHDYLCSLKKDYKKTIESINLTNENVTIEIKCDCYEPKRRKQDGINWSGKR